MELVNKATFTKKLEGMKNIVIRESIHIENTKGKGVSGLKLNSKFRRIMRNKCYCC